MNTEQQTAIQRKTRNRLAIRERQKTALELRLAGKTYREIAAALGYKSPHGAYDAVTGALAEVTREPAEELRKMELARLDALHAALWPAAIQGDPVSVAGALRVSESRRKLLGLDLPEGYTDPKPERPLVRVYWGNEVPDVVSIEDAIWVVEQRKGDPELLRRLRVFLALLKAEDERTGVETVSPPKPFDWQPTVETETPSDTEQHAATV